MKSTSLHLFSHKRISYESPHLCFKIVWSGQKVCQFNNEILMHFILCKY